MCKTKPAPQGPLLKLDVRKLRAQRHMAGPLFRILLSLPHFLAYRNWFLESREDDEVEE
jgi:hypothetical protein